MKEIYVCYVNKKKLSLQKKKKKIERRRRNKDETRRGAHRGGNCRFKSLLRLAEGRIHF